MQEVANLRGMAVGARARSLAQARVIGGKIRVVRFFSFSLSRQPTASHAMPLRHWMPELPGPCDIETAARKGFLYAILSVEESMNERHERCKDAGKMNAHLLQTDKFFADLLLPFVVPYSISMHINTNSYFRNTGKFCSSLHFYEALCTSLDLLCFSFT